MTFRSLVALTIALLCLETALSQTPSSSPSLTPSLTPLPSPSPDQSVGAGSSASAPEAVHLIQLLKDFLAGASKNDPDVHERFWADDLIYTSSSGRRLGKADILRDVKSENTADTESEPTTFTAENIRVQQYGTTAVIAFRLVGTTLKGDKAEKNYYLNTGTFLKRDNRWQVVAWQATKQSSE